MEIKNSMIELLRNIIVKAVTAVAKAENIELEPNDLISIAGAKIDFVPDNFIAHADVAINVAMVMAKKFGTDPMLLAQKIASVMIGHHVPIDVEINPSDNNKGQINIKVTSSAIINQKVDDDNFIESIILARPGFINLKLAKVCYVNGVSIFLKNEDEIRNFLPQVGQGNKINLEFVSANPTGPLHIGHVRGAIYGQTLANLLEKVGFDVVREYYINDGGSQISTLLKSALLRYKQAIQNLDHIEIPESCYPGDYLIPVGKKIAQQFGDTLLSLDESSACKEIRKLVIEEMMNLIKDSLAKLGVHHDVFVSEKAMIDDGHVKDAIELLRKKNLCYKGMLDKPKGIDAKDWVQEEQELFRSSSFGDSSDRAIARADGSLSYFAPDVGYHYYKYKRGFNKMILVLGADHKGYSTRISAAVQAISDNHANVAVRLCEMVNFVEDGQIVKSSKRSGKFLTADDILAELDLNVLKFIILSRRNDTILDFDLKLAKSQSKENPVFYTQYAYSRCMSLLRGYKALFGVDFDHKAVKFDKNSDVIDNLAIRKSIILCNMYPEAVLQATITYDLNILVTYALNLASQLHTLWGGSDSMKVRFLNENNKSITDENIAIVYMIKSVMKSCLDILGVHAPESM